MSINQKSGIKILEEHKAVHEQYAGAQDASLEDAHREICTSMRNRGLIHKIEDALDEAATPIRGLYLSPPHGELIHGGKQKAIVRPQPTDFLSETFELCSNGYAYGHIRLGIGQKVSAADFDRAEWFEKHRVTAHAHKRWWPEQSYLWVYEIADFQPFDEPRPIQLEPGTQTFMKSVVYQVEVPDLVKSLGTKAGADTVLVSNFLWLVGGAVEHPDTARDVDVLYRAGAINDNSEFTLNAMSLTTAVRDALGVSGKSIDHLWNPAGPHQGKAMPVADLVLRWKDGEVQDIKVAQEKECKPTEKHDEEEKAALTESSPTGPRAEAAAKFWAENWWKMFPPSGKGTGTYQHHYPALTEEQLKQGEGELLGQDVAVHGDLRLTSAFAKSKPSEGLWGFTPFLGKASEVKKAGGCRLCQSPPLNLQGTFKLPEPIEWLNIASGKPHIELVGEGVGVTGKDGAKFFEVDHPAYEMGVWREHLFEIFLDGKKLKGRFLIEFAPVAEGRRVWLINKPEDQTPYAESHKLEETLSELKGKGQKHLVWGKPGERPVLYDTGTGEPAAASAKAGRRLRRAWADKLADWWDKVESQFDEWRELFGSFRSFVEYEDRIAETLPDDWLSLVQGSKGGFKAFRGKDGKRRWFAWAASAFEDREEEIFSTKSLENDVAECYETGNHGKLWFHHLPIYLGDAEFSALVGRILLKSGTWADNKIAQAAAAYYERGDVPDEGASVGYRHRITEPGEDGVYHWIRIFETSPVPIGLAAFPFSRFDTIGDKTMFEMNDAQVEHLKRVFGDEWEAVIENVKTVSGQLEEAGLAFKAVTNPVATLKKLISRVKDPTVKTQLEGVIETLEMRDQEYGKPTKAEKPKEEKPKDGKTVEEGEKTAYDEEVLSALVEGLGLQEVVEAVKSLSERVDALTTKLEEGDEERLAKKIAKVAPIVAYQQSVAALTDDSPEGQKDAPIPASDPLAQFGKGTIMGIRK